ncbi:SPOR domain-containing protein, partial [Vicingaceae bacterium]|nr:SPOR domain-containing protein [Vicingaceae bacterium]
MLTIVHKDIFTMNKDNFYNENVPVPITDKVPTGLVYKLQIGFFKSQLPPEHFQGIFPLSSQKIDEIYYRYVAGNFANYKDAKDAKESVIEKGYSDSFIVAFLNGEKISISDALNQEGKE